jgi:hypothetical protein
VISFKCSMFSALSGIRTTTFHRRGIFRRLGERRNRGQPRIQSLVRLLRRSGPHISRRNEGAATPCLQRHRHARRHGKKHLHPTTLRTSRTSRIRRDRNRYK